MIAENQGIEYRLQCYATTAVASWLASCRKS